MATALIRHTYPLDEAAYWRDVFFDDAFNSRLFLEHLRFSQWEVSRFDESDATIRRDVLSQPSFGALPAPLAKLVGDSFGIREEGVFDKASRRYTFTVVPNRLAEKLSIRGEIYVEPRSEGRCERFVRLDVVAKILGLSSVIEKRIISETTESFDRGFAFTVTELASR